METIVRTTASGLVPVCEDERFESRQQVCVALPEGYTSTHDDSKTELVFVNGINTSIERANRNATTLANFMGRPVYRVYNSKESLPILGGVLKVLLSKGSHALGVVSESQTIKDLLHTSSEILRRGKDVSIHAHSHGAVITRDALRFFVHEGAEQHTQDRNPLADFDVTLYGTAQHAWPVGATVKSFVLKKDYLPLATQVIDAGKNRLRDLFSFGQEPLVETTSLPSARLSHSFERYISALRTSQDISN